MPEGERKALTDEEIAALGGVPASPLSDDEIARLGGVAVGAHAPAPDTRAEIGLQTEPDAAWSPSDPYREHAARVEQRFDARQQAAAQAKPLGGWETALEAFGQAAGMGTVDEVRAWLATAPKAQIIAAGATGFPAVMLAQWFGNPNLPAAPGVPAESYEPRAAVRGGGATTVPAREEYEAVRDRDRQRFAAGTAENPIAAAAGGLAGGLATGMATGGLATSWPRTIAAEAALGGATGAGLSVSDEPEEIAKDAAAGAALSGGLTAGVAGGARGLQAVGRVVADKRMRLGGGDDAIDAARRLNDPANDALRRGAIEADEALEGVEQSITAIGDDLYRASDAMTEYARRGMKVEPVRQSIVADGVRVPEASDQAPWAAPLEDLGEGTFRLVADGIPGGWASRSKNALRALDTVASDLDLARGRLDAAMTRGDAQGMAEAFVILDRLKADVGRAVRLADKGSTTEGVDHAASGFLRDQYERLRQMLENPNVWGRQAAAMQQEINAAWVPFIRQGDPASRALTADYGAPSADVYSGGRRRRGTRDEVDPTSTEAMLRKAGESSQRKARQLFEDDLRNRARLNAVLEKYYGAPDDEIAALARGGEEQARRAIRLFDEHADRMEGVRALETVRQAEQNTPNILHGAWSSPAQQAMGLAQMERLGRSAGPLTVSARGARRGVEQAAQIPASYAAQSARGVSLGDVLEQRLAADDPAMREWSGELIEARAESPDQFVATVHRLAERDPRFRQFLQEMEDAESAAQQEAAP